MSTKKEDHVRILRVYEFTGPRSLVEAQVAGSIHGDKIIGNGVVIKAATVGIYPEVLIPTVQEEPEKVEGFPLFLVKRGKLGYLCPAVATNGQEWEVTTIKENAYHFSHEDKALSVWRSITAETGNLIREFRGWRYAGYGKPPPGPLDVGYLRVQRHRLRMPPEYGYVNHGSVLAELKIVETEDEASTMTHKASLEFWHSLAGSGDWKGWSYSSFIIQTKEK